uniref:Mediator of RNA polymerase II transcription subunit 14 n=1 Tax=Zeugodacus cucurbitae TaxID=28588 RepID=A0A0A1X4J0_ZEUCU
MNFCIIYSFVIIVLILVDASTISKHIQDSNAEVLDIFGTKVGDAKSIGQVKRDTSLSYAATNIDSKEGTRVKTITVIKNHSGKNDGKLVINPNLHKNEDWANAFRDNFDSYGGIPDVPDIDELFDFVKHKPKDDKNGDKKDVPAVKPKDATKNENTKPTIENSSEVESTTSAVVEKIKGDAEVISGLKKNQTNARSLSLGLNKELTREPLTNTNYTSTDKSKNIYFEKYIQDVSKGYDYPKPCPQGGKGAVSITNPSSGRSYDIPVAGDSPGTPYIAPSITKKTQVSGSQPPPNSTPNVASTFVRPNFSVNSILPSLQPTSANPTIQGSQQPSNTLNPQSQLAQDQGGTFYTSQRPYVAPNLRSSSSANGATTPRSLYRNDIGTYRGNTFLLGANRANSARSRGLKYR